MKKKITLILTTILLLTNLVGCGKQTTTSDNIATPVPTSTPSLESANIENNSTNIPTKYDSSITIQNGIAYFNITPDEFVKNYNATLTNESKYVSDSLTSPKYTNSGMGIQRTSIYQYDVSNSVGHSIHTYIHADENNKIVELCIGIKKTLGNTNVDLGDVLYNQLGNMAMVLTDLSQNEWKTLADGLAYKIANRDPSLYYYYNGILLNTYSDENAVYFKISCITEDLYFKYK